MHVFFFRRVFADRRHASSGAHKTSTGQWPPAKRAARGEGPPNWPRRERVRRRCSQQLPPFLAAIRNELDSRTIKQMLLKGTRFPRVSHGASGSIAAAIANSAQSAQLRPFLETSNRVDGNRIECSCLQHTFAQVRCVKGGRPMATTYKQNGSISFRSLPAKRLRSARGDHNLDAFRSPLLGNAQSGIGHCVYRDAALEAVFPHEARGPSAVIRARVRRYVVTHCPGRRNERYYGGTEPWII